MTSLSPEQRKKLLEETRHAAIAFVEDMEYFRDLNAKMETNRAELRRLSVTLRRLLVDADVSNVATPRVGRVKILAPNNELIYKLPTKLRILFFSGGGATVFGIKFGRCLFLNAGKTLHRPEAKARAVQKKIESIDEDQRISLRLDDFLSQRVICYRGLWITRRAVIKHVAHMGSGAHSDTPKSREDGIVEQIRSSCRYDVVDGKVQMHVLPEFGPDSAPMTFGPANFPASFAASSLDPLLVELLATAQLLATSPDLHALEKVVMEELASLGMVKNNPRSTDL